MEINPHILGNLPADVVSYMVQQNYDPQLYSRLSSTSPRLQRLLEPYRCRAPITLEELIDYVQSYQNEGIGFTSIHPPDNYNRISYDLILVANKDYITFGTYSGERLVDPRILPIAGNIYSPPQYPTILREISQLGYRWLDLRHVYGIVSRRQQCYQLDPGYPLEYTLSVFEDRFKTLDSLKDYPNVNFEELIDVLEKQISGLLSETGIPMIVYENSYFRHSSSLSKIYPRGYYVEYQIILSAVKDIKERVRREIEEARNKNN